MQSIPILNLDDSAHLLKALEDFLEKSEATFAMLIDRGGAVLAQHGALPSDTDSMIIAALAAGSFAATKELARRLGEAEFNALHQQGQRSQVLTCSVDDDAILVTVFGPQTTQGLVRFYSANAIARLAALLNQARTNQQAIPVFTESDVQSAQEIFNR